MKEQSLDPRINRLDLSRGEGEQVQAQSHLPTWEVFHQEKRGKQAVHAGIVHASSPDMALVLANAQYARRGKTANLWVVRTSDVYTFKQEDDDVFETVPEKTYREPSAYKVRDRIEAWQKLHPEQL
jgi:phenylacetate-CoA oxygenase PaaH subunit